MDKKSCFFIGHREASEEIYPILLAEVERHVVELGVTEFIVGHYGGFDSLAAKAVITTKHVHPELSLLLLLPYHPSEHPFQAPSGFDCMYYPPNMERVPRRLAIVRANRYVVDHVDYLIAYVWHAASHARDLVIYAQKREIKEMITISLLKHTKQPSR